jgi:GxxExxY protein
MVGTFIPDFVVDNKVIVELKTIDRIADHEKGQVLNYLKASGLEVGLIYNFKFAYLKFT